MGAIIVGGLDVVEKWDELGVALKVTEWGRFLATLPLKTH